jgi:glutathione synthase/RimK-type ligase-like ATP-grasp enzyme
LGGFEGEGKKEMYEQLPPGTYPRTIYIDPALSFDALEKKLTDNNFDYPFIVKPDVGMMGFMVRKISNRNN